MTRLERIRDQVARVETRAALSGGDLLSERLNEPVVSSRDAGWLLDLVDLMEDHIQHSPGCCAGIVIREGPHAGRTYDCDCGLDELRKELVG